MFERCLFCRSLFKPNQVLQHLPSARRLAYDPERGRLWAICRRCGRWCLIPIELRWEAVEELEDLAKRLGVAARADGISLVVHKGVRVLRVGRGGQREETWWRYERQFRIRRVVRGPVVACAIMGVVTGVAVLGGMGPVSVLFGSMFGGFGPVALELNRITNFTGVAWRGRLTCPKCEDYS